MLKRWLPGLLVLALAGALAGCSDQGSSQGCSQPGVEDAACYAINPNAARGGGNQR